MDEKLYRTGNIKKVAHLIARSIPLHCSDNPRRPGHAEFSTLVTPELIQALEDFENNNPVPVKDLFDGLEYAKDRVMEIKRGRSAR